MKRFWGSFLSMSLALTMVFVLTLSGSVYAESSSDDDYKPGVALEYVQDQQKVLDNTPKIGCKAAYVANPDTGKVIYEKDAHKPMYPASTTKLLTALLVMENCDLKDKATVTKNALSLVPSDYMSAKLEAGEKFSISDLLHVLLIPSANDAAFVLAEHVSGNIKDFVSLLNSRAKELGCENLHFVNPNGIHDDKHYCTAYDLYLIAKECKKHDIFNKIVTTKSYTLPGTDIHPENDRAFQTTNELLLSGSNYYSYCTGVKTGHTDHAGECLVASSSHDGIDLISVVLGGKIRDDGVNERFSDTRKLLDFAYDNYSLKKIAGYGDVVTTINVDKATKDTAGLDVIVDTDISSIMPDGVDGNNVQSTVDINDKIVAPINQNQVLGKITYNADGLIYTTNIVASHSVERIPYWLYNSIAAAVFALIVILIIVSIKRRKKRNRKSAQISGGNPNPYKNDFYIDD